LSAISKTTAMPDPLLFRLGRGLLLFLALGEFQIAAMGRPTKEHVLNGNKRRFILLDESSLVSGRLDSSQRSPERHSRPILPFRGVSRLGTQKICLRTLSTRGLARQVENAKQCESITASSEVGNGASGSGTQSGSTFWSYSGSGSYTDVNGTSGIAFYVPGSGSTTITGSVTGTTWTSASTTGVISGSWSNSASGSASINALGSGAIRYNISNSASYSGGGSFTAYGAVNGGGTIIEHGWLHTGNNADQGESISPSSETANGASGSGTHWPLTSLSQRCL
jgi:hypothetical protein